MELTQTAARVVWCRPHAVEFAAFPICVWQASCNYINELFSIILPGALMKVARLKKGPQLLEEGKAGLNKEIKLK